jgi:hypothetical protein
MQLNMFSGNADVAYQANLNPETANRLTLTAAWINPRIQHGPWSDEISVLIN